MGWERKRGKIEEFNRLLRGADRYELHDAGRRRSTFCRRCAIASRSIRTPGCRATPRRTLIGIIAHPLNRPRVDPAVAPGHGGLRHPAAARQRDDGQRRRIAVRADRTPATPASIPYTTAVSDVYQDLFGEGIFTGKGLYDVDAFTAALEGRVPENALLSHDLFEGSTRARARYRRRGRRRLSVERARARAPAAPLGPGRLADPAGGCSRTCRRAAGWQRNRLPLISRWKILDNLRRSLVARRPSRCSCSAGRCLRAAPRVWTLVDAGAGASAPLALARRVVARPAVAALGRLRADLLEDLRTALARAWLQLTFVANQACEMTHAIGITLVRFGDDPRSLLEWQTAAAARAPGADASARAFVEQMRQPRCVALGALAAGGRAARARCLPAAPILVLWFGGAAAWRMRSAGRCVRGARRSRPPIAASSRRRPRDMAVLRHVRRRADHGLPPDNVQLDSGAPDRRAPNVADQHRDGLLAALAAHDFGFIGTDELPIAIDATLDDDRGPRALRGPSASTGTTRATLAPLPPRYISSVDSGNLAARAADARERSAGDDRRRRIPPLRCPIWSS